MLAAVLSPIDSSQVDSANSYNRCDNYILCERKSEHTRSKTSKQTTDYHVK